jgi:hypothetical protein
MAVITNINGFKLSFTNEHTVYENYITAQIKENEFNLSYNPSLRQTGSNAYSQIKDFATGSIEFSGSFSVFNPYATTLGLYNDDNELLMVAKFGQPVPISVETDMTFLIRYDT